MVLGSALVDEDDARVEKSLLAGDAGEHRVGDEMRDPAGVGGVRHELTARRLLARRHVEQTEVRLEAAVAAALRASGQHELRVDRAKGVEIGRLIGVGDLAAGDARPVDRLEKHRPLEIIVDDAGDGARGVVADETGHGDVDRLKAAAGVQIEHARGAGRREGRERPSRDQRNSGAAGEVQCHGRFPARRAEAG